MSRPITKRRRTKAIGPDSIELAKAFTHKTITSTNRSGIVVTKRVLVPLVPIEPPQGNAEASSSNVPSSDIPPYEDDQYIESGHTFTHMNDDFTNRSKGKVRDTTYCLCVFKS
jgi:hypothetical protein